MGLRRVCAVALLAVVVPPAALADSGMTVRKTQVRPGERMTAWGNLCFDGTGLYGMRVYLVAERHQWATVYSPRAPSAPPYHFLGRFRCTHTDRPQPFGDGGHWTGTLTFRVPPVTPGRYELVFYCAVCHRGPGGKLVINNRYFEGKRRNSLDALIVTRR
jgi:hypothetical protein